MAARRVICHACQASASFDGPLPRQAECAACGVYLRCCLNCEFYDEAAYNQCREPVAERVVDKQSSNFCDCFSPSPTSQAGPGRDSPSALSELDDLFTKK